MQQQSYRIERINELIHRELVILLKTKINDQRIKNALITDVITSRDLSSAKVFFSSTEKDKITTEKLLNKACGFLRTSLAKNIDLRHTPELKFVYDSSINTGARIDELLSKI